ncbi:MAG TPA: hypothetical protein K8V77_01765 [Brachyspira hyodysenteriae]|nr:hypothetical protein [Brachyspira hyodysenteriae]
MENKEIIFERMGLIAKGEYNSNKCICCQNEIKNVDEENITINLKDEDDNKKSIVLPVCDDCKIDMLYLISEGIK